MESNERTDQHLPSGSRRRGRAPPARRVTLRMTRGTMALRRVCCHGREAAAGECCNDGVRQQRLHLIGMELESLRVVARGAALMQTPYGRGGNRADFR